MKKIISLFIILYFSSMLVAIGVTSDPLKVYHEANISYQKQEYEKSISLYEDLVKNGKLSFNTYYNLGNAYFKSGNFSKAILNYERALKISPDDEDATFNLKIASLKVVDKIESVPEIFYKRWINALSTSLSSRSWTILFILLVWILFISIAVYMMSRNVSIKKLSFVLIIFFLVLCSSTGVIAARSHAINFVDEKGIIMSSSVYVKSSPDDKGNDLFILHEGTKVEIMDNLNEWLKIRIANGSVGWMKSEELTKI